MKRSISGDDLFNDAWGWLALVDVKDAARNAYGINSAAGTLITTDYVLGETIPRLFSRCRFSVARRFTSAIVEGASSGTLRLEWITPARFHAVHALRLRFRAKLNISSTDLTSFAVMRELG